MSPPPGLEQRSEHLVEVERVNTSYAMVLDSVLALYHSFHPVQPFPLLAICDVAPPNYEDKIDEESVVTTAVPALRWGDVLAKARSRLRALAAQMVINTEAEEIAEDKLYERVLAKVDGGNCSARTLLGRLAEVRHVFTRTWEIAEIDAVSAMVRRVLDPGG